MANPLSIAASVAGILGAVAKVYDLLSHVVDGPECVSAILAEVCNIRVVLQALQGFLSKIHLVPSRQVTLIQIENIVIIVTQTVWVFSELETILQPLTTQSWLPSRRRLNWMRRQPASQRLVIQLQKKSATNLDCPDFHFRLQS
ncbi:hypothetical protein EDB80DRAFT_870893 [Ilyonectria destructans]|nr:hypothetical protein EDB80DRAFT_870893 [Ilyonectria destructans]